MFRNELKEKLKGIFGLSKVTFDAPGESYEQDTLFIEIQKTHTRATQGKAYAKIEGSVVVYSRNNKLTYGFFNKRLSQVDKSLTKDFFFFDFDVDVANSPARIQNINERRLRFIYLYSAQYDPNQGSITSAEFRNPLILNSGEDGLIDSGDGSILEG